MLLWPRLGPEGVGWVYLVSWLKLFAFDRCGKFWTGNNVVVVVVVVVVVSSSCSSSCRWSWTTCWCWCWCWCTRGVFLDSATPENINSNKTTMTTRVLDVMKSIRSETSLVDDPISLITKAALELFWFISNLLHPFKQRSEKRKRKKSSWSINQAAGCSSWTSRKKKRLDLHQIESGIVWT